MVLPMADKRKILFISDAVSGSTGLSRITRDISTRVHEHLGDLYTVASYGYGSPGSSKIPFPQFVIEGMDAWVMPTLPEVCEDFFGKEKGIIFTIFDLHRVTWLSQPKQSTELFGKFPGLQQWAIKRPFELWGYVPLDSSGPNDRLTFPIMKTLLGFDRLLAYGAFGEGVIRRSIGDEESDKRHLTHLPHGINTDEFYEQDRKLSRRLLLEYTGAQSLLHALGIQKETAPIAEDECLVGICATNQNRKNWPLAIETCAILARNRKLRLWAHTDAFERYYSLPSLLVDYGLLDRTVISMGCVPDSKLATAFSACDLTLGIGPEGWGLPLAESLACSTPVVTGSYAGASGFVPKDMQVDPIGFYKDGSYSSLRPVYRAEDWAAKAEEWIGKRTSLDSRYDWENLWRNEWEPWFRAAAK